MNAPRIPLQNHLVQVSRQTGALPVAGRPVHFTHLHDTYLHEVDGEDCREIPLGVIAALVNRYKDNFAKVTMLLDLLANRGIGHDMTSIRGGSITPAKMFYQVYDDDMEAPAESFVTTAEGKQILPLDLKTVCDLYGIHHEHALKGPHPQIPSRGGQASVDAIEVMDELMREIGLEPNHQFIRQTYCAACGKQAG